MEHSVKLKYCSKFRVHQHLINPYKFNQSSIYNKVRPNFIRRPFVQKPTRVRQRLIPLTSEILNIMKELRNICSDNNVPKQQAIAYSTLSITNLVREEVRNVLNELAETDKPVRKEDIDALIEKCLKEDICIVHEGVSRMPAYCVEDDEIAIEMRNERERNNLIVENFQILDQRVTTMENRLDNYLKSQRLQAKQLKINSHMLRKELRSIIRKLKLRLTTKYKMQATAALAAGAATTVRSKAQNITTATANELPTSLVRDETKPAITTNIKIMEGGSSAIAMATKTVTTRITTQTVASTESVKTQTSVKTNIQVEALNTSPELSVLLAPKVLRKPKAKILSVPPSSVSPPIISTAVTSKPAPSALAPSEPTSVANSARSSINYDDLYYAQKQYAMNLLYYKKSATTLLLNNRTTRNPFDRTRTPNFPLSMLNPKPIGYFIDVD